MTQDIEAAEWKKKLEKYPSLRKFDELGDDYTEVQLSSSSRGSYS
jgi:hypothetical protein